MKIGLRLFLLGSTLIALVVAWQGIRSSIRSSLNRDAVPSTGYGVIEVDCAVQQIEIGVSTWEDVTELLGPYIESKALHRLKDTGTNRTYFFVPRDRQLWMEFGVDAEGTETVSRLGELEPRAKWIGRWEGGYITFDPSESPW